MSGINTSLFVAMHALEADQGALSITGNNIANAQTPGYSRQVAVFEEAQATQEGSLTIGNGVVFEGFQSIRDELLNGRIQQQTSAQSSADTQTSAMQQIEPLFTSSASDIATSFTAFYKSLSALSDAPTSVANRSSVLSAAQSLVNSFHATASGLADTKSTVDSQVKQGVLQVNQLASKIAALDAQVVQLKASGQDGGSVQDQRDQLTLQLSKLTAISITQSNHGETITTSNGTPLIADGRSFTLQTAVIGGTQHVLDQSGNDITTTIQGGSIGGAIQLRDRDIPKLAAKLDALATDFAGAVNDAQSSGFDMAGTAGTPMFSITPATHAAANIQVAIADPSLIAASSDPLASGSSGNMAKLLAVQNDKLNSGMTPSDSYASLVFDVGNLSSNASAQSGAVALSLTQLTNQQGSVSGVNIDEEASNLIRFQTAYQAAAHVVSVISQLNTVILNMGTGG